MERPFFIAFYMEANKILYGFFIKGGQKTMKNLTKNLLGRQRKGRLYG